VKEIEQRCALYELTAVFHNLPEASERAHLILFHVLKHPDDEIKI